MDLATCLKKMELVGVLAFATVDSDGAPQIRNISAIHYESDAIYFFTARGKNFCKELLEDGRVHVTFNVYNWNYSSGIIEVYDSENNLKNIEFIVRMNNKKR